MSTCSHNIRPSPKIAFFPQTTYATSTNDAKAMLIKQKSHSRQLADVLFSQLEAITDKQLTDEMIESLLLSCGDSMLLASLDLIDSNEGAECIRRIHCIR